MAGLTIGKLATICDVSADTIRYYEKRGLIRPAARKPSGYRSFDEQAVRQLRFIRHAKDLGFSLDEIETLLALRADSAASCESVREMAARKAAELRVRATRLDAMAAGLERLVAICPRDLPATDCPILELLHEVDVA